MFRKFVKNTVYSFLALLLMSVIFTCSGFLVLELFKSFAVIVMVVIFCVLLFLGYVIGGRLHCNESMSFVSIILLPIIISVVIYALCMIAIPVVSMMIQYPAAIWLESLNLRADDNVVMFYAIALAHYLVGSLSLLIGAYKKK